jgi:hypothetical protein
MRVIDATHFLVTIQSLRGVVVDVKLIRIFWLGDGRHHSRIVVVEPVCNQTDEEKIRMKDNQ